jgi:hypothetical protein
MESMDLRAARYLLSCLIYGLFHLNQFLCKQSVPSIEEIIAQLESSHKTSKRNFESIRNECRTMSQQGTDKDGLGVLKKMGEDVMKAHKQCAAEISATKKLREDASEEIAQGISRFGILITLIFSSFQNLNAQIIIFCSERAWTSY